jgi:integrase
MSKSNRKRRSGKARPGRPPADPKKPKAFVPPKPYKDFPLTPHSSGKWQKKITVNGSSKIHYFGRWGRIRNGKMERIEGDGWKEALDLYKAQADDLHSGRTPRVRKTGEGLKLKDLCNHFLTAKQRKLKAGEITAGTFSEYRSTTDLLIRKFGKERLVDDLAADDFGSLRARMADDWGPVRLSNEITRVKSVFKYGYEAGLLANPIRYGPEFVKPSASVLRKHRAKNGKKMLDPDEVRQLIDAAPVQLKAMILLGLNGGLGNYDCATLPLDAVDLEKAWLDYARPKTGIERRFPLWPETLAALKAAIAERPEARQKAAEGLVFVRTQDLFARTHGQPWITGGTANPVSVAVRDLMKTVGVHREGFGPYVFRHVFETVAGGARDQVAVNHIMGHADDSMAAHYREQIEDSRLVAVTDHVRSWLFSPSPEENDRGEK